MRLRKRGPSPDGLMYLSEPVLLAIRTECRRVETQLDHVICGRYLGTRDGRPNVCWKSRGHAGSHL
jgi:hypothetical protein